MSNKGIHHRGYLPHWDFKNSVQAITFRLNDSLPLEIVKTWKEELQLDLTSPDLKISEKARKNLHARIANYEDSGNGSCLLKQHGGIVQQSLLSQHGKNYKLIAWCIMPNHVHVIIRLLERSRLGTIVQQWKGGTAFQINRLENRSGPLWMMDYHDRYIRDIDHLQNAIAYIRNNPVKAGLCAQPEDWPFSSAALKWSAELQSASSGDDAAPSEDAD